MYLKKLSGQLTIINYMFENKLFQDNSRIDNAGEVVADILQEFVWKEVSPASPSPGMKRKTNYALKKLFGMIRKTGIIESYSVSCSAFEFLSGDATHLDIPINVSITFPPMKNGNQITIEIKTHLCEPSRSLMEKWLKTLYLFKHPISLSHT